MCGVISAMLFLPLDVHTSVMTSNLKQDHSEH